MGTNGVTVTPARIAVSRLSSIKKGRIRAPLRYVIYGPEGVGKSTLAAYAPAPIWADIEGGSNQLDVPRYSFRDGDGGHVPVTYDEVDGCVDDLLTAPHEYQTFVVDTLDKLESLVWAKVCTDGGKVSIEDFGYGKGYVAAVDRWRSLMVKLDRLRTVRGMQVVLLAHASVKTYRNPDGEDFDRWQLRLNDKAAGLFREWADVVGFATYHQWTKEADSGRVKGYSSGDRVLKTLRHAAYDAKTRIALPEEIVMESANPWAPLAKAVAEGCDLDIPAVVALITTECERVGDEAMTAKVRGFVDEAVRAKDVEKLNRILQMAKSKTSKEA